MIEIENHGNGKWILSRDGTDEPLILGPYADRGRVEDSAPGSPFHSLTSDEWKALNAKSGATLAALVKSGEIVIRGATPTAAKAAKAA